MWRKVVIGLTSSLGRRALIRGVGAAIEHRRILASKRWSTIFDVGANKGQFALAARRYAPGARVLSFEPLPSEAQVFRDVLGGEDRVTLHPCALGPKRAMLTMHLSSKRDSSSLLPILPLQSTVFPGTHEVGTCEVEVRRLADVVGTADIQTPALLKIDVQGFELDVLRGCDELLDRFDAIYVECSFCPLYEGQALFAEVALWLAERNFTLSDMGDAARDVDGRAVQADFLFERTT